MGRGTRFSQRRHVEKPQIPVKQYKSPLITLPPELRTRIFDLIVIETEPIRPPVAKLFHAAEKHEQNNTQHAESEGVLSLARTCHQLHDEVLPVYYGNNTFEFGCIYDLYRYLYMIGPERRALLQRVTFSFRGDCKSEAFELLAECTLLRELKVLVSWETTKGAKYPQRDLLETRGLRFFGALKGYENLKVTVEEVWDEFYNQMWEFDRLPMQVPRMPRFQKENILKLESKLNLVVARKE